MFSSSRQSQGRYDFSFAVGGFQESKVSSSRSFLSRLCLFDSFSSRLRWSRTFQRLCRGRIRCSSCISVRRRRRSKETSDHFWSVLKPLVYLGAAATASSCLDDDEKDQSTKHQVGRWERFGFTLRKAGVYEIRTRERQSTQTAKWLLLSPFPQLQSTPLSRRSNDSIPTSDDWQRVVNVCV
jgi:hypothetical protein